MRPTSSEILVAIRANIEELLLPAATTPHAESSARNALMLLDHVLVRLEHEGEFLCTDNAEKRAVLTELAERMSEGAADDSVRSSAEELAAALGDVPEHGPYVTIADLAAESEALHGLLDRWVDLLWSNRGRLGADVHDRLRAPVRAQLRAQLDRDAQLVAPITLDQIFQNRDA